MGSSRKVARVARFTALERAASAVFFCAESWCTAPIYDAEFLIAPGGRCDRRVDALWSWPGFAPLIRGLTPCAAITAAVIVTTVLNSSHVGAGTFYPSYQSLGVPLALPNPYAGQPNIVLANTFSTASDGGTTIPWLATLFISEQSEYFNNDTGFFLGGSFLAQTAPATGNQIEPFVVDGMPAGFVVQSVSSDLKW